MSFHGVVGIFIAEEINFTKHFYVGNINAEVTEIDGFSNIFQKKENLFAVVTLNRL